jgi:hypothetical protein
MYLREKTVRRINRQRAPDNRIGFLSKTHLARAMLQSLPSVLPECSRLLSNRIAVVGAPSLDYTLTWSNLGIGDGSMA